MLGFRGLSGRGEGDIARPCFVVKMRASGHGTRRRQRGVGQKGRGNFGGLGYKLGCMVKVKEGLGHRARGRQIEDRPFGGDKRGFDEDPLSKSGV